jgi:hypothetical protein
MIKGESHIKPSSARLAATIEHKLNTEYPAFSGYWVVTVNEIGGTIEVTNEMLSGKFGFLMHTAKIDPELKKVVRAGGELLERYNIARNRGLTMRKFLETTNLSTLRPDFG